ncbi:MAG TPA: hypothetical protein VF708_19805 [Pyrinomonadaceae bacterium]|jgi:hypothetical protein
MKLFITIYRTALRIVDYIRQPRTAEDPYGQEEQRERRTGRFKVVPHETQAGRYRIVRVSNGKPCAVIDGLRRAEDLVAGCRRLEERLPLVETPPGDFWRERIARIDRMVEERKERMMLTASGGDEMIN